MLNKIAGFFKKRPRTRIELNDILKQATREELLEQETFNMIEGVLDVQETRVNDVMIPRPQMITIDHDANIADIMPIVIKSGHSRFPVTGDNKDEIIGIILAKDLLNYVYTDNTDTFMLRDIMRNAVFVPESKRLNVLLKDFRVNRNHMAIVVDEYGRITGLITIEDVIEQIVGDIEDEHDIGSTPSIRPEADGSYTVKALTTIEEFNDYFDSDIDQENSETIGGMISKTLGHMPKRGEGVRIEEFYFTVLRSDNRRIYLLNVVKNQEPQ